MMKDDCESLISNVADLFLKKELSDIDLIVGGLFRIAGVAGCVRLSAGDDMLEIASQNNMRQIDEIDDAVGRLRMVLARLFVLVRESYVTGITGSIYGFSCLNCPDLNSASGNEFEIVTRNIAGFPELTIRRQF